MPYRTARKLYYAEVKGLHQTTEYWWASLKLKGWPFELKPQPHQKLGSWMDMLGRLHVPPGYMWDGSSGPTIDGKADPVPSLVHDTLYEAIRAGLWRGSHARKVADNIYHEMLRERGMGKTRAGLRWLGLRLFGWWATRRRRKEYPHKEAR